MDLRYVVFDDRYFNVRDVLRAEFRVSARLLSRLKNCGKVFFNREDFFFGGKGLFE